MKHQINFRASDLASSQLDWLMAKWGTSQTETLTVIIDRIYQQERIMNAQKARRIAVEAVANITFEDPAYIANSTVVVGVAKDGTFWVADNGEEVDGLTKDQAIDTIVKNLAE